MNLALPNDFQSAPGEKIRRYWVELSDINWGVVFVIYTVTAIISTGTDYTSDLAQRGSRPYFYPLLWELTGHYAALLLLPLIILGISRIPIRRDNWPWAIPVHLLISAVIGCAHTLLMWSSRVLIYSWLGLGSYDYGAMGYRFLMEYHKQFLSYCLIYCALLTLAHYRLSREREQKAAALELEASQLQRQLAEARLLALRSQLNPHFLFNTLNMVSSVMYEDVDRADHMIAALSRMLRMSLEENVGARVPVRRELEFVGHAIELIRARFQDQVCIEIDCAPDTMDELIPNMLVYTFIENAIKHHDLARESMIRIEARVSRSDSTLDIDVIDNGPGIQNVERAMKKGIGLGNTRQRLAALYGSRHRFEISNRPEGGLRVHVAIPARTEPIPAPV